MGLLGKLPSRDESDFDAPEDAVVAKAAPAAPASSPAPVVGSIAPAPGRRPPSTPSEDPQSIGTDEEADAFASVAPKAVEQTAPAAPQEAQAADLAASFQQAGGPAADAFASLDGVRPQVGAQVGAEPGADATSDIDLAAGDPAVDEGDAIQKALGEKPEFKYDFSLPDPGMSLSHDMLMEALRATGLDGDVALEQAIEYHTALGEIRENLKLNDLDKAHKEELLAQAMKEAASQTSGGGVLSSLLGKMIPGGGAVNRLRADVAAVGNERRKIIEQQSGAASTMRDRVRSHMRNGYAEAARSIHRTSDLLGSSIADYNEAFLATDAGQKLMNAVVDADWPEGLDREEIFKRVRKGEAPDDVVEAFKAAKLAAEGDEAVVEAKKRVEKNQAEFMESVVSLEKKAEGMQKNFPEEFRIGEAQDNIGKMLDMAESRMPDPIDDDPETGIKARMRKFREDMQRAIEAFIDKMQQALGIAPR